MKCDFYRLGTVMDPGEMSRERDRQTDRELLLEDIEEMYDKQAKTRQVVISHVGATHQERYLWRGDNLNWEQKGLSCRELGEEAAGKRNKDNGPRAHDAWQICIQWMEHILSEPEHRGLSAVISTVVCVSCESLTGFIRGCDITCFT